MSTATQQSNGRGRRVRVVRWGLFAATAKLAMAQGLDQLFELADAVIFVVDESAEPVVFFL